MGVIIGYVRRPHVTPTPVQLFDRQIQRSGQSLDYRLGGCPQSPFDLREIRIGNSDRLGQLAQGQRRKLTLFADDRPQQTLWSVVVHFVRLAHISVQLFSSGAPRTFAARTSPCASPTPPPPSTCPS